MSSEPRIKADLYCALKSAIAKGIQLGSPDERFEGVEIEFPINDKKADLVVMKSSYKIISPFLIIEVKKRTFQRPGQSLANATRQAKNYAGKTQCFHFAVCDGWLMFLFQNASPYLINVYGVEMTEDFAKNLLVGVAEYHRVHRISTSLDSLPRPKDPDYLKVKILPQIAHFFAFLEKKDPDERGQRKNELLTQWVKTMSEKTLKDKLSRLSPALSS